MRDESYVSEGPWDGAYTRREGDSSSNRRDTSLEGLSMKSEYGVPMGTIIALWRIEWVQVFNEQRFCG
jgi:hypothetical protein